MGFSKADAAAALISTDNSFEGSLDLYPISLSLVAH